MTISMSCNNFILKILFHDLHIKNLHTGDTESLGVLIVSSTPNNNTSFWLKTYKITNIKVKQLKK